MATAEHRMLRELAALSDECRRAHNALDRLRVADSEGHILEYGDGKYEIRARIEDVARVARSAMDAGKSCPRCGGRGGECPCP